MFDRKKFLFSKKNTKLSVIFSFRNEQEVLPELIKRTCSVLDQEKINKRISSYELIFVNDASTDRSLQLLLKEAQKNNAIRIINLSRRFGPSPSVGVMAGMSLSSGDAVIYMDSDLQDPPEIIPQLLDKWRSEDDIEVVHTIREFREGESRIKLLITRIGYFLLNKISTLDLPVESGDYKLLSRRAVNELLQLKEKKPYLRGLVHWIGFKQAFVKYKREARFAGKTKFNVFGRDVINNFFDSALISFSAVPLKIAVYLGFFAILVDFGLICHVINEKLIHGRAVPGWSAIMITVLFIGSVQLLCIGIIGLYLNSIFEESKGRPNYIIDSTHGFPANLISTNRMQKYINN